MDRPAAQDPGQRLEPFIDDRVGDDGRDPGIRERGGDEARVADAQRVLDARLASQVPSDRVAVTGSRPPATGHDQSLHLVAIDVRGAREPLREQAGCRRLASARVAADDPDLGVLRWRLAGPEVISQVSRSRAEEASTPPAHGRARQDLSRGAQHDHEEKSSYAGSVAYFGMVTGLVF